MHSRTALCGLKSHVISHRRGISVLPNLGSCHSQKDDSHLYVKATTSHLTHCHPELLYDAPYPSFDSGQLALGTIQRSRNLFLAL
jgi:hypothetical protein